MLVQNHTKATFRARAFFTASGSTSSSISHGGGTAATLAPEEQHSEQYVTGGGATEGVGCMGVCFRWYGLEGLSEEVAFELKS